MSFLITTTGTLTPMTIDDLGARTFTHPTVSYDLEQEYTIEEIRESVDLGVLLDAGHVTAVYGLSVITTSAQLASIITAHTHSAAEITSGTLPINRGGTNSTTYTVSELLRMNAGGTAFESAGVTLGSLARVDAASTYGTFLQRFRSTFFSISNNPNDGEYVIEGSANGANTVTLTIPGSTVNDDLVLRTFAQSLTNKTIDASLNTLSNISDASIDTHTSTKISITNKLQLNSLIVYTDQANVFGAFDQTFQNARLKLVDNSTAFRYIFNTSTLAAHRNITLPALTSDDEFVFKNFAQTLSNKTINATSNTLTDTGAVLGAILKHNGTKYVNLPVGATTNMVLVSDGTDASWQLPKVQNSYAVSASTLTTTSAAKVLMTGMTFLIAAPIGTSFLIFFSGMASHSTNTEGIEIQLFAGFPVPTAVAGTTRTWSNENNAERSMIGLTGYKHTVSAVLETLQIHWSTTSATASIQNPHFVAIRCT